MNKHLKNLVAGVLVVGLLNSTAFGFGLGGGGGLTGGLSDALGGVTDTVTGTVNEVVSGVTGGGLGDTVSIGGGDGRVVSVDLGDVGADVSLGGSRGIADVNLRATDAIGANVNVGGPGGLLGVDVGLNLGGTPGVPGAPGAPGTPGNNANNGNNGNNGMNGRSFINSNLQACAGTNTNQLLQIFQATPSSGWNRASNIRMVPVRLCSDLRRQLANFLQSQASYPQLMGNVMSDALVNAALSRSNKRADQVLGVQRSGSELVVYVF